MGRSDIGRTRPVGKVGLRFNLWLVEHRLMLKRLLAWALGLASVGLYAYTLGMVIGLARSQPAHQAMLQGLAQNAIDYPTLRQFRQPQPLQFGTVAVLPSAGNRKDLAVMISNPNQNFYLPSVRFEFVQNGTAVAVGQNFLLPGETKQFLSFGVEGVQATVQVALVEVAWQRVQPDDFRRLAAEKLQLVTDELRHAPGAELGPLGNQIGGQTTFAVTNASIFGVWDVGLYVLLLNGDQLVAAQYTNLHRLDPGERQSLTVSWPQALPLVTNAAVIPELNPYDASAFYQHQVPGALPR